MAIRIDGTNATANPGITGDDADTGFVFGTDQIEAVTGGTTRFTVESGGNCTIENGNLVLASGSGIDFSATADGSGTMTSELLDDYEEGTWTPTIVGTTTAGTGTYTTQKGNYTKIGNIVYVRCRVAWSSHSGTGNFNLTNLPYNAPANIADITPIAFRTANYAYNAVGWVQGYLFGSIVNIETVTSSGVVTGAVSLDTAADFSLSCTYEIA